MTDLEWGKRFYCLSCKKDLGELAYNAHIALGHKCETYKTMPRPIKTPEIQVKPPKDPIPGEDYFKMVREDYAEVEESEPIDDVEIGQ